MAQILRYKKFSEWQKELMKSMYFAGSTLREISDKFDIPYRSLCRLKTTWNAASKPIDIRPKYAANELLDDLDARSVDFDQLSFDEKSSVTINRLLKICHRTAEELSYYIDSHGASRALRKIANLTHVLDKTIRLICFLRDQGCDVDTVIIKSAQEKLRRAKEVFTDNVVSMPIS